MEKTISIFLILASGMVTEQSKADFTFGTPTNLGPPISTPYGDLISCISADGLEMYLNYYNRPGGNGGWDIWISTRETVNDDWGAPDNLGSPVNTGGNNQAPYLSADELELYFNSYNRSGGYGDWDLWLTKRATKNHAWGIPESLGPVVNSLTREICPSISSDGLELYFGSRRSGGYGSDDIWVSRRATKHDPWGQPSNLGPVVNSSASEAVPFLSSDGLLLFFSEALDGLIRPGGFGNQDMWVTRRASISAPWGAPVNLGPTVNSPSLDAGPRISADGSALYFSSDRPGGLGGHSGDIYQAPIIPIVDLNADGIVDAADMCIMVDYWGTDEPLCDIGPMPWGDGTVDAQDLIVLTEHLFEEVDDPTLVARWKLDEAEGDVAYDSAATHDAVVIGDAIWQPEGGKVDGALQFDGINNYIDTPYVLDPADGPLSVFAWIKGGEAGQVILSQVHGANWLMLGSQCYLETTLKSGSRMSGLTSETVVTDDTWHRVGFTWDGENRVLYVDDIEVARDTHDALQGSQGGLYIGAGKDLESGSFWSGLIDDVRIYDRIP